MKYQSCLLVRRLIRKTLDIPVLCSPDKRILHPAVSVYIRHTSSRQPISLPRSATLLQQDKHATVVLLGTVHFSKQSVEDVSEIVKVLNPNAILVELCRQRVSLLELDDKKFLEDAKNFDAQKIKEAVRGQNFVSGMLHAMLLKTYADIAKELGVAPGGEFRRAYHEMKRIPGCKLFLGDRPIQITIARAFQSLSVYELGQVLYHLTTSNPKPLDKEQLERYKDRDFVQAQFEEITKDVPAFKKIFHVFVDERDKCLAYSLQECVRSVVDGPRVLAVVGMGHVDGIVKYYGKMRQEDIVPLLLIPPEPYYRIFFRKGLKLTFYFLIFSFFYRLIFG
ncbi:traB domain-containing protein-like isoform X2 [Trichoplusia ni]|uniref:TraB domain-containing protein-like isoform X2 n=1 Tax=Trichoplusia ni TaxID=7111 RepID=A0A7E5WHH0_TRINI|nr:traB domain-containing protein-like isoform X2 [Trichoplusia ni]